MKRPLFILYIVVATLFSGCYEGFNEAERGDKLPTRNTTIADLKGRYPNEYHTIEQDIVCEGRVTSSDRDGNFYRSLFIEDESGGLEILLGIYDSYTQYPVGRLKNPCFCFTIKMENKDYFELKFRVFKMAKKYS